jgi:mono/diheme cytochrome c family protein
MKATLLTLQLMLFFTGCLLSACSAYDLGSAGQYEYKVDEKDVANPPWDEVVSIIVEKKCATCHTTANPWYKPKNVPSLPNAANPSFGLDYIGSKDFFKADNSLLTLVKKCIETSKSTCGKENIPMPPSYATPLYDQERTILVNFVSALIPAAQPGGLSQTFLNNCSGCHPQASGYGSAASGNKKIGESRSDTFDKYKNTYKTLAPMPALAANYTDEDALADWKLITGK